MIANDEDLFAECNIMAMTRKADVVVLDRMKNAAPEAIAAVNGQGNKRDVSRSRSLKYRRNHDCSRQNTASI